MNLQRLPPYSEEAEIGVLGSILVDSVRILDMCMEFGLTVEDFHVPAHQKILMAIGTMASNNKVVDVLTVAEKLKSNGDLEKIGGSSFIERLVDSTPTALHCQHYLEIIKQKTLLRNIISGIHEIENDAYQCDNPEELRSKAEALFTKLQSNKETKTLAEVFNKVATDIHDAMTGKPIDLGISTEYEGLDSALGGGMGPGVHWLSGAPGAGKTSLKNNIILRQLQKKKVVASLTLEMTMEQEIHKLLSIFTESDVRKVLGGKIKNWTGAAKIPMAHSLLIKSKLFYQTDQSYITNSDQFQSWARRMVTKFGAKLICVDYLQLLEAPKYMGHLKMEEKVSHLSDVMKNTGSRLGVPILCLTETSPDGNVRGSRRADYAGAAHWQLEQVGDTGPAPDYVKDIVANNKKARFGIDQGKTELKMVGPTGVMEEPSKADEHGIDEQTDFIDNAE